MFCSVKEILNKTTGSGPGVLWFLQLSVELPCWFLEKRFF